MRRSCLQTSHNTWYRCRLGQNFALVSSGIGGPEMSWGRRLGNLGACSEIKDGLSFASDFWPGYISPYEGSIWRQRQCPCSDNTWSTNNYYTRNFHFKKLRGRLWSRNGARWRPSVFCITNQCTCALTKGTTRNEETSNRSESKLSLGCNSQQNNFIVWITIVIVNPL